INLGWNHWAKHGSELFVGAFHRRGSLAYTPGSIDTPQFIFFPDTLTPFNLRENRNFNTTGVKLDYQLKVSDALGFKFGALASITRGNEAFTTVDAQG